MVNLDGVRENIDTPVDIEILDANGEVLRGSPSHQRLFE